MDVQEMILHPGPVNVSEGERVGSVAVGAALTLAGAARGALPGVLLALGGLTLVHRGLTGHCMVFATLGVDTAEAEGRAERSARVDEASMESFPASDAPAFTGTTAGSPPAPEGGA